MIDFILVFVLTLCAHSLQLLCRFKFTKLSQTEPNRAYSFVLTFQPDNNFVMSKCVPELDAKKTDELVRVLNSDSDDGWMYFVVGMSESCVLIYVSACTSSY